MVVANGFFGWSVAWSAFTIAVFAWGIGGSMALPCFFNRCTNRGAGPSRRFRWLSPPISC